MALDRYGNTTVVWGENKYDDDGVAVSGGRVYAAYRPAGGGWSEAVMVSRAPFPHGYSPVLAVSPQGRAVAAWEGSGGLVTAYRSTDGTWYPPSRLRHRPVYDWSLGIDDDGVVTYLREHAAGGYVAQRLVKGGTAWQQPAVVTSVEGREVNVAVNGLGRAVAVWQRTWGPHYGTSHDRVESASRPVAGPWGSLVPLYSKSRNDVQSPEVILTERGTAMAAWKRGGDVEVASAELGRPWGGFRTVGTDASEYVELVGNRGGDAAVTWLTSPSKEPQLLTTYKPESSSWSAPQVVTPPTATTKAWYWDAAVWPRSQGLAVAWAAGDRRLMYRELRPAAR